MIGLDVPEAWQQSRTKILQTPPRRILLLGSSDVGKSCYCRFLADGLTRAGQRVAVVDADIGQKTMGPPATVTLGFPTKGTEVSATRPEAYYFVGSVNPIGRMLPLVVGVFRLVASAEAPCVIVDTTGYIEGAGRILKDYKIDALRPDLIIAIERENELESVLRAHRMYRTIRLRPSPAARSRTQDERKRARETLFAAYFRSSERLELRIDDLIFQRSPVFSGEPLSIAGTRYAERTADGVVAVAQSKPTGSQIKTLVKSDFERNLLCGVADERDIGIGLAIVEGIDFRRRTVSLVSPVRREHLRTLQFGDMYLSPDGHELGRLGR